MNFLKNLASQQTVSVTSYPMCSAHNRPLTYMCLSKTCVSKLFCEYCVSQNHGFHQNEIQNISDFLARVPYQRKSSDFSLITQVKSLINIKNKIVSDMSQSLTNSENKILDHFDELKKELNFQLDLAYSEYCQKNRDINTKTTLKVESKMKKMGVILKLQEIMVNRANVEVQNQDELQNLVKYVSKHMDKLTQLGDTLKAKQKELDQILVEHDHVLAQFDGAKFQATKNAISTFVRKAFNIKEVVSEPQANVGPDPTRMENRNSGGSQEGYTGHEGDIYAVSILNKQLIATGGQDRVIKLWNLQNGECTGELYGHKDKIWALISAYEGKYILSASEDKTIKVWKLAERKCTKTFLGHTDSVQCLEYLKVQKILASGSGDGLIMLWDMNEGKASKTLAAHKRGIWALHGMKNENLISAGSDCLIKIWDSRSWGCLQILMGHKATVYGLCSFNNEQNLISCSEDETLRVWEIREGICVQVVKGHDRGVRSLGMNVSETLVATGGADRCLKIWDLKSLKLLKTQENNDAVITSTQFYDDYSVLYADRNPKFFKLNVI